MVEFLNCARRLYLETEKLITELNNETSEKPQKNNSNADIAENQYTLWLEAMRVAFRDLVEKVKPYLKQPQGLDGLLTDIASPSPVSATGKPPDAV